MITSFMCKGQVYLLKIPLVLTITKEGDYYFAWNEYLDLAGCSKTEEGARQDALNDLEKCYEWKFEQIREKPDEIDSWILKVEGLM